MSVTTLKTPSPIEQVRNQLTKMKTEFENALPSHIKHEKFQRVVLTVVQQTPDLLQADRRSLLASCIKCASDGLIPDGREAALVIFNAKEKVNGADTWVKKVQYMPMLGGLQKRARNSGEIAGIIAQVVRENDEFVQKPDDFEQPIYHRPPPLGQPRGKVVGAYAMAKLKDGTIVAEVMDTEQLEKVRNVSRSKDRGPWVDWYEEMCRKTVFKRLNKWLPATAEVDDLIKHDNDVESGTIEPQAAQDSVVINADEFEAASMGVPFDAETGEVVDGGQSAKHDSPADQKRHADVKAEKPGGTA